MAYEYKESRGSLFKVEEKTHPEGPDYTGKINVGNTIFDLAGWKTTAKSGKTYLSVKISPEYDKQNAKKSNNNEVDLPF
ncbi:MAG: hypothetical protein CBB96_00830 [Gammaproteobacteria bacterium TMED36]|nr:MAG: hypothetical protein CBB96_00830 [Gammaproteobacteria bacterium TMED36]|tara:strand:+ start:7350 stop:7586 length:237 start_codon:yes stop_codon:yes gene_type:complete